MPDELPIRPLASDTQPLYDAFASRLVTQMYFPGDPLLALDPIYLSIPDEGARARLVSSFDIAITRPEWALGYRFDVVLRGREATLLAHSPHPGTWQRDIRLQGPDGGPEGGQDETVFLEV